MEPRDRIENVETLHEGWMTVLCVRAVLAGQATRRTLISHPSGSAVLAFDPARRVAFTVRQSRLAVMHEDHPTLVEGVAGVTEDERPIDTARREAREELGLALRSVECVGQVWMTPSSTTERVHLFLAEYAPEDRVGPGGGADGEAEELDVREEPLATLWDAVTGQNLVDAKLFMLLQALRIRRPELFDAGD